MVVMEGLRYIIAIQFELAILLQFMLAGFALFCICLARTILSFINLSAKVVIISSIIILL